MERHETLSLEASPEEALAACRRAFAELGWEIVEEGDGRLAAMEVPFRLNCLARPAEVEVRVRSTSPEDTIVALEGSVRGVGSRPLGPQMAILQEKIRARLP